MAKYARTYIRGNKHTQKPTKNWGETKIEYTGSIAKFGRQEGGCPIDCRLKTRDRHYQRVAGVPAGVDAWVKTFVAKKARSVITDVTELDVVSDGLLHNQLLDFCQNARMAFLGRNTC